MPSTHTGHTHHLHLDHEWFAWSFPLRDADQTSSFLSFPSTALMPFHLCNGILVCKHQSIETYLFSFFSENLKIISGHTINVPGKINPVQLFPLSGVQYGQMVKVGFLAFKMFLYSNHGYTHSFLLAQEPNCFLYPSSGTDNKDGVKACKQTFIYRLLIINRALHCCLFYTHIRKVSNKQTLLNHWCWASTHSDSSFWVWIGRFKWLLYQRFGCLTRLQDAPLPWF